MILRDHAGSDAAVIEAMLASTRGFINDPTDLDVESTPGRLRYLMRNRHGSPFEHGYMRFYVETPIFVAREFMRHRIGWSYNEMSGRYRELEPVFWIPSGTRPLVQVGKPGAYEFTSGTPIQRHLVRNAVTDVYVDSWKGYQDMLTLGVAREVARTVLPVGTYTAFHVSCNPRSLMSFLSLRTRDERAAYPSGPQAEIEEVAAQMEIDFGRLWPLTYQAFNEAGRVAP